jgi:hypothetical protein
MLEHFHNNKPFFIFAPPTTWIFPGGGKGGVNMETSNPMGTPTPVKSPNPPGAEVGEGVKRDILLNALPLNAIEGERFNLTVIRITPYYLIGSLKEDMEKGVEVVNYIRHPATVSLLNTHGLNLVPSSGLYSYRAGDVLFIVTVKTPVRGQEVEVKFEDLDCFIVFVKRE